MDMSPPERGVRPLSVLLSAYACEPDKGSEPGIGWKWARNLSTAGHRVHVITRENNRASIERALAAHPLPGVSVDYYDLPRWARWWKKGGRGVHLYYFLWQWGAFLLARRLCRRHRFDLVHHITFGVFRQPSFMAFLGLPFVFGPVGGGERAPYALRRSFPLRGKVIDFVRDVANRMVSFDPVMRAVYRRCAVVLCKTRETLDSVPRTYRDKCKLQLEIGVETPTKSPSPAERERGWGEDSGGEIASAAYPLPQPLSHAVGEGSRIRILYVGRLVYLKGVHLGLPAFARLLERHPNATLTIVGAGPEEHRLKQLATDLKINHAIEWRPWLPQGDVMKVYPQHDVFLFPSLHDSSGNAVLEALSFGLPVVCMNLGGPGVLVDDSCGVRVSGVDEKAAISELGQAMIALADDENLRRRMSEAASSRANEHYSWPNQTERMCRIYASLTTDARDLAPA